MRKQSECLTKGGQKRRLNQSTEKKGRALMTLRKRDMDGRQWPVASISEAISEQPSLFPGPQPQQHPKETKHRQRKISGKPFFFESLWQVVAATKAKLPSKQFQRVLPFFRKIKSNRNSISSNCPSHFLLKRSLLIQSITLYPNFSISSPEDFIRRGKERRAGLILPSNAHGECLKFIVRDSASLKPPQH